jgi:hypothetical protein
VHRRRGTSVAGNRCNEGKPTILSALQKKVLDLNRGTMETCQTPPTESHVCSIGACQELLARHVFCDVGRAVF